MSDRLSDADLDRLDRRARRTPGFEAMPSMPVHPGDVASLVAEVRAARARETASEWETEAFYWMRPEQCRRRLVGPWEAVTGDD